MRWDNLRLDDAGADAGDGADAMLPVGPVRALPLIERGAVARTFDTPGFRGMTFYEVQARSIVNRVPEASRMSFNWTINPYRGCQHACSYCAVGETPVLMTDGRTKALADVRIGDEIYGTVRDGSYRRYAITTVLAHWSTVKSAYRVSLEDGTELVCSGDHRFLTERGWKHVTGAECGPRRRPFLTVNNTLMGMGGFAEPPKETVEYRRGYLCGMIRGDATSGHYSYLPRREGGDHVHLFRLALADREALARTTDFLAHADIHCHEFTFTEASPTRRQMMAIRTGSRDQIRAIERLIAWPMIPSLDWRKGFLAGIFDAEGSYSGGILRLSNTDPSIIDWLTSSLGLLEFQFAVELTRQADGLVCLRLTGGLKEAMRFFHTVDPAITRKRSIADVAIKSDAKLRVAAIEPLGLDLPMYDITTGTGDFIANGVVSHNCFARNTHTYLDLDAGADFNTKVVVKVNAPELVRKKLASPGWQGEHIAMGTNVDPYQRAEGRYQLMRGIIGALRDAANPFSILTKGTLVLRDIELLASAAEVTSVGLNVSAGFVDETLWRSIEPGTPAPARRLEVCAALNDRGLGCGVLMGPIIPYLSDSPAQLEATVRQIAASGAIHIVPIVLHLRPGAREWFLAWLRQDHPTLMEPYRELYGRSSYANKTYQARIAGQVRELAERYGVGRPRGDIGPRTGAARAGDAGEGGDAGEAGRGGGAGNGRGDPGVVRAAERGTAAERGEPGSESGVDERGTGERIGTGEGDGISERGGSDVTGGSDGSGGANGPGGSRQLAGPSPRPRRTPPAPEQLTLL
ncbi:MAG: intein-containing Rv2578c family radical SAM protein [Streptosporangiaceae bacterium]|nr:intein-containing Rv2578c family radical SAM protein [Streptosporangiaceae bacterium]